MNGSSPANDQTVFNHIAPELVAIDDQRNGWRYLVLQIAVYDDLIMHSVLSVAAFHFAANTGNSLLSPTTTYSNAIDRLRQRQDLSAYDTHGKQVVILSLLVLLVTSMVSGCADFRTILNLIDSAWNAAGAEEDLGAGELGLFVTRQSLK